MVRPEDISERLLQAFSLGSPFDVYNDTYVVSRLDFISDIVYFNK